MKREFAESLGIARCLGDIILYADQKRRKGGIFNVVNMMAFFAAARATNLVSEYARFAGITGSNFFAKTRRPDGKAVPDHGILGSPFSRRLARMRLLKFGGTFSRVYLENTGPRYRKAEQ